MLSISCFLVLSARPICFFFFFFFNDTATTEIYTLSLHDALPIFGSSAASSSPCPRARAPPETPPSSAPSGRRSEEHTSELQSLTNLVCRLLLEKKKKNHRHKYPTTQALQKETAYYRYHNY